MKHIKKKFHNEIQLTEDAKKRMQETWRMIPVAEANKVKKMPEGQHAVLKTLDDTVIFAFHYSANGNNYFIPEPDPILIYFNNAQFSYGQLKETKQELLKSLRGDTLMTEELKNRMYEHFGLCNGFVIFLFTALEAFINKIIPDSYQYIRSDKRSTEVMNKDQIQRYMSFDDKVKIVLPKSNHKNFSQSFAVKYQHIDNLKKFRDMIMHTKPNKEGNTLYDYLFKQALDFKYEETLLAVRDFMNHYQNGYVVECNCGQDF